MNSKLPLILIGLIALAAGVFVSVQFSQSDNSTEAITHNESAQSQINALAKLQETLQTSLALPLDFKTIADFKLLDVNGKPITQQVFEGQWSMVFFGYTHCPDVCPITLQVMKNVVSKLAEQNQPPPQIVFVTVDPVRDTSEIMKEYVAYFNSEFVGITGELNLVHEWTRSLGIVASFTANDTDPDNYLVDHTASLLLIDPQKRLRAKISPPHKADTIITDFLSIVAAPS